MSLDSSSDGEIQSEDEITQDLNPNLEEGELETRPQKVSKSENEDSLEEGEVSEDEQPAQISVCRFFGKGLCTWGGSCRFLHPGVNDKGLYTMFEPLPRPPPPTQSPSPQKQGLLGDFPLNNQPVHVAPLVVGPESAWERGLRHAKEIIKQSVKRKETDVDFEEKKMNLSLAQEEIDKENDYFVVRKPMGGSHGNVDVKEGKEEEENDEEKILLIREKRQKAAEAQAQVVTSFSNKIDPDFVRREVHHVVKKKPWKPENKSRSRSVSSSSSSSKSSGGGGGGGSKSSGSSRRVMRKAPPREVSPEIGHVRIAPPPPDDFRRLQMPHQQQRPPFGRYPRFPHNNPHPQPPPHPHSRLLHPPYYPRHHHPYYNNRNTTPPPTRSAPPQEPPESPAPNQPPQNPNRYYRSKFQRRSSSSSSSSSSTTTTSTRSRSKSPAPKQKPPPPRYRRNRSSSSSSSSYGKRRLLRKRDLSSDSSSDSSSSLDTSHIGRLATGNRRTAPPVGKSKSKSPAPATVVVAPAPKFEKFEKFEKEKPEPKRIKLTIDKKNFLTVKNDVVVEKLADFETENQEEVQEIVQEQQPSRGETPREDTTTKSRREELMKQLRAVEEAILKKRSKIDK